MKRLINLGIVLGIVLVIIGCQKDEFNPTTDNWEKTRTTADFTSSGPASVFEPAPDDRTDTGNLPGTVFEPGVANTPDIYPYETDQPWGGIHPTTGDYSEAPGGGNPNWNEWSSDWPELPADINERNYSINWQYNKPTDTKWQFIESTSVVNKDAPSSLCPYDDCDEAIAQAVANLQVQANILCQDLYVCVVCCIDGYVVYAMVVAFHDCGVIEPPSDL